METQIQKKGITSDMLKWIAVITMLIDHIGAAVVEKTWIMEESYGQPLDYILRFIGRLAFPIFCFLMVEGFYHTRSRMKYIRNLFIFAVISEIPFELSFLGEMVWGLRNVYWTLLIGMIMLVLLDKIRQRETKYGLLYFVLIVAVCSGVAEILHTDYGAVGVILIFILYKTRDDRFMQCILGGAAMSYEITAPIAFVLLYKYNGVRRQKHLKYFFYIFYPAHLLLLYGIRLLIV